MLASSLQTTGDRCSARGNKSVKRRFWCSALFAANFTSRNHLQTSQRIPTSPSHFLHMHWPHCFKMALFKCPGVHETNKTISLSGTQCKDKTIQSWRHRTRKRCCVGSSQRATGWTLIVLNWLSFHARCWCSLLFVTVMFNDVLAVFSQFRILPVIQISCAYPRQSVQIDIFSGVEIHSDNHIRGAKSCSHNNH